jgi:hypothetical protein
MPSVERLYNELRGENFEILAVSVDAQGLKIVAPFMKTYKLPFPALIVIFPAGYFLPVAMPPIRQNPDYFCTYYF